MGSRYLTDLADVCRRAGLTVIEVGSSPSQTGDAWKSRGRGSGGYDSGKPNHVMAHHTASSTGAAGWDDANYCTFFNENAPVCNLYLGRDGRVWVCAAGATNTNGSGRDPCGVTPNDSMNTHAIGIEGGNNGTGEPWPTVQQDAYVTLCRALCDHYGIPTGRIHSHFEYAPDRKIDPAGSSRYATGSNKWNMPQFRGDVDADDQEDDDMTPQQAQQLADIWTSVQATNATLWGNSPNPPYPESVFGRLDANLAGHGVTHRNIWGGPNGDPPYEQSIFGRLERIEDELNKLRDQHG